MCNWFTLMCSTNWHNKLHEHNTNHKIKNKYQQDFLRIEICVNKKRAGNWEDLEAKRMACEKIQVKKEHLRNWKRSIMLEVQGKDMKSV